MITRSYAFFVSFFVSLIGLVASAFAATVTVDDLWTAVDLSSISTNVITLLIVILGIKLVFVAFGYIRSSLARARG